MRAIIGKYMDHNETKLLNLLLTINKLKETVRTGWPLHGVKNDESVADHSFQVAIMAMFLADKVGVDQNKSIQIALIHDLGEIITGDEITERGDITLPNLGQKLINERDAFRQIFSGIEVKQYIDLYDEFIAGKTPEAKFVRQLDKLETAIQAHKYSKSSGINLDEFYVSARKCITDPILLGFLNKISNEENQI